MVEFPQMWFIFQHLVSPGPHTSSIGVAALGFLCYRSSPPDPRKSPQLQIYDLIICLILTASQPSAFFHVGEQKIVRWCQIRRIWRVMVQFKRHSHTQQPLQLQTCVQEHCPSETGLPSSVFQAVHEMSLVLLFKVLNYISSVGLSGRK